MKIIENFQKMVAEVFSQLTYEEAKLFCERFEEKLNEQKCITKNFRTSR